MGVAKLAVSADGDSTHIPATVADGLLVDVSNAILTIAGGPVVVTGDSGDPVVVQPNTPTWPSSLFIEDAGGNAVEVGIGAGGVAIPISDDGDSITVDGAV